MTMIDDDRLAALFAQAGDAFEVPASGSADILERALAGPELPKAGDETAEDPAIVPLSRPRRMARTVRSHRMLSVAASVVVLLVIIGGAVGLGSSGSKAPLSQTASAPSTTHGVSGAGTPPLRAAPAPAASSASGAGVVPFGVNGTGSAGSTGSAGGTTGGTTGTSKSVGSNLGQEANPTSPVQSTAAPNSDNAGLPSDAVGQSSKIEQTGSLSLTVGKGALAKTMSQLTFLASLYNGFVATSQSESGNTSVSGVPNGSITLQVPVDTFADVLKKAQALGKTASLTTKATDVTGQYVDLQSRITSLQDSRQQYLTIMAKATSVGDVLAVQAQLDTIQSEIEQLQGQLQVLTSETAYSTLTVSVSEGAPPVHHVTPPHRSSVAKAWHDSVHGFLAGVDGLIRVAGPLLFALLCLAALIFGGRLLWRRYQRHNL